MRALPGPAILPHLRSVASAAKEIAARTSTSHRKPQLRDATGTRFARAIHRSLARHVDPAAAWWRSVKAKAGASFRVSFHTSPDHACDLQPKPARQTHASPSLVRDS